jgi:hypothetical protein
MLTGTRVFGIAAIALVVWSGLVIHHKNHEISALNREVVSAHADGSESRAETQSITSKFNNFKANVAEIATSDMVANVNDAAGMGGAVAVGCAPGYTRSSCDWWYEPVGPEGPPEARAWGAQALKHFGLANIVQNYGDDLVKRAIQGI